MSPGPRPTTIASGILIHPAVWSQQTSAENWGVAVPLFGGAMQHNVARAEAYVRIKWDLHPSSRLATIHGPKLRGDVHAPLGAGLGSPSSTMSAGPSSTSLSSGILIHPVVWPQQTCMGRKLGAVPLWRGGSPSNTMWPGPSPTTIPSGIVIHPALSPQEMGRKLGAAVRAPFFERWFPM